MASSTRAEPLRQAWIPETPDNEAEVMRTMGAYQQAISTLGISDLMAELTRINAAMQQQGQAALAAALTQRLEQTIGSLDSVTLRSRPTGSPLERGQAALASRPFRQPPPLPPRSTSGGLGRAAAARIAAAHQRRQEAK
jgi:hypothetical protein